MSDRQTDSDAGRWISYAQLAEIRGISKKAAQRLTLRHRWRRQPANDGGVLVWVPDDAATQGRQTGRQTDRHDGGSNGPAAALLEDANRRADEANKRADVAMALADRALAQLADAGERAGRLERDLAAALSAAEQAEAVRDQAEQATTAERARADALRDRLNAQRVAAETTEAHAAALRERLDAMQAQLTEAHAALQAAVETERRAAQAEQEIAGERTRATGLRAQIEVLNAEIIVAREEAERALSEERVRADHLSARVDAVQREVDQANARAEITEQASEVLRQSLGDMAKRVADDTEERRALGRWARLRRAWRGE